MQENDFQRKDLPHLTAEQYEVPKGEEKYYHCRIEVKKFDPDTGERLSRPVLQKFEPKFFETFGLHHLRQQGYTVDILHNPREWEKGHAAQAEAEKSKKDAAAKAAEREAIKAEIMEELKASGAIPAESKKTQPQKK